MRSILLIFILMLTFVSAKSQKFQPGFFIDTHGQKVEGLIRNNPGGKAPVKGEAFILYKDGEKGTETRFSASDIKSYVIGPDSFVVAHAPRNESWSAQELDFVRVVLNEEVKLYVLNGGKTTGGGSGFSFHPGLSVGTGIGGGGYGGVGLGTGVGVGLGGGGNGSGKQGRVTYYTGANTAEMREVTIENFNDAMMDVMGDEPKAMEAIRSGKFTVGNINGLIKYFKDLKKEK